MNILIYGIGGIGGYFGGKLALTNHHVTFIARGKQLRAIQENGLKVKSILGDFHCTPNLVTDDPKQAPTPDLVIMGVKSWQLAQGAAQIATILGENSLVLPLQNGVDNPNKLIQHIDEKQVLCGFCNLISFIETPGVVCHFAFPPTLTFGELNNSKSSRIQEIDAVFKQADIKSIIPEDIHRELWKKFMFITTISAIGGLCRAPIGDLRESEYITQLMRSTAEEILSVAQAKDIDLRPSDIEKVFETITHLDGLSTASTQRDLMAGKPSELETFNGYIVKQAKQYGIPVPVNEMLYECLLPMERQAREKHLK
ncbi:ketopantoate reductase family protein [Galbibacter sp.]|jgi:2-dehydropantoate 2-reductase|uniref:ketopantoate reductase family protein n=1 Tax=Galbibacter sp. TaxID=2918471 RepID=UPI003A8DFDA5